MGNKFVNLLFSFAILFAIWFLLNMQSTDYNEYGYNSTGTKICYYVANFINFSNPMWQRLFPGMLGTAFSIFTTTFIWNGINRIYISIIRTRNNNYLEAERMFEELL